MSRGSKVKTERKVKLILSFAYGVMNVYSQVSAANIRKTTSHSGKPSCGLHQFKIQYSYVSIINAEQSHNVLTSLINCRQNFSAFS